MKAPQILSIVLAFALGAGLVFALKPSGGGDKELEEKLAAAEARIKALEAQPKPAPSALLASTNPTPEPSGPGVSALPDKPFENETDTPASPEDQMNKLINSPEMRNLAKLATGFMAGRSGQMIDGEMKKWTEKLGLTDAQATSIKAKITEMMEENTKKLQADLDDSSKSMRDIMEAQGQFWQNNEPAIEEMLKGELTEDQYAAFEYEQLQEKTQNVQRQADWELRQIDRALELDEAQEDQVFSILVRESRDYDPAMAIEGTEATLPEAAVAEGVSKEDAIRSVLTPEQTETYNGRLESGGFGFGRRGGPFGGGGGFGRPR